jgi:hypothetical protein
MDEAGPFHPRNAPLETLNTFIILKSSHSFQLTELYFKGKERGEGKALYLSCTDKSVNQPQ